MMHSEHEYHGFSHRNLKSLSIEVPMEDDEHGLIPADSLSWDEEDRPCCYEKRPGLVMRMNDFMNPEQQIFVNVFRSSEIKEHHIVAKRFDFWYADGDGDEQSMLVAEDDDNDEEPAGSIVHSILISNKDYYRMKVDSRFKTLMLEAVTRYLDMLFPDIHMDCDQVAILSSPVKFVGNFLVEFPRSIEPTDIALLLHD